MHPPGPDATGISEFPDSMGRKNRGRRIPCSDARGPFGGAIVLSLTDGRMPQTGRAAITRSRETYSRPGDPEPDETSFGLGDQNAVTGGEIRGVVGDDDGWAP